jgi:hypothetical protein
MPIPAVLVAPALRYRLVAAAYALLIGSGAMGQAAETVPYTVVNGDTLIGLRDRLMRPDADWREVQKLNRVADPRRLRPGSTLLIPLHLLREQPAMAEALHVHGDVRVTHASGNSEAVVGGMTLAAGAVLRAARQSSAVLRFADGARVLVRPDSELRLERLTQSGSSAQTQLELRQGSVDSSVPPSAKPGDAAARRYQIRTPVANLGVRGTEFRARLDGERTGVEVLAGRVATAGGSAGLVVDPGFGSMLAAGTPPRAVALLDAPDLGPVAQRIERLPLQLNWNAQPGATAYRAQVMQSGRADALMLDGRFDEARARFADDLPDGRYALRVRGIDANGLEGRDAQVAFTLKARPEPPFVERPREGQTAYDENVDFAWTRHSGVARYRLQIAANPAFEPALVDRSDLADPSARIALPPGNYVWRLASLRADGDQGPFGDPQTLLRRAPPASPPPAALQTDGEGLRLRWPAASEPGASYAYQFARDPGFTQIVKEGRTLEPTVPLGDPAGGSYSLRVRTIAADGFEGPWGAAQQIDVPRSRWWWLLLPAALWLL